MRTPLWRRAKPSVILSTHSCLGGLCQTLRHFIILSTLAAVLPGRRVVCTESAYMRPGPKQIQAGDEWYVVMPPFVGRCKLHSVMDKKRQENLRR